MLVVNGSMVRQPSIASLEKFKRENETCCSEDGGIVQSFGAIPPSSHYYKFREGTCIFMQLSCLK